MRVLGSVLLLFFVKIANCVADVAGVAEERAGGVEALAGDFGDGAVETHLAADLVAGVPSVGFGFGRSVLEAIRRHPDIEAAGIVGIEFFSLFDFVGPPMGEDLVVGGFFADLPV